MTNVRRVVTGHDAEGKAAVASDSKVNDATNGRRPGRAYYRLWGANDPPQFPDDGSEPSFTDFFPPVGGYRFVIWTIPPRGVDQAPQVDSQDAEAEEEKLTPGLVKNLERNTPGMRTSDTIDFGYVISGEIWLELDNGKQVNLIAGDTFAQKATRHRWLNYGSVPCSILFVLIGAHRNPSGTVVAIQAA